jgi:AcrR family transcriptional regulator
MVVFITMPPQSIPKKTSRAYRSELRQQQAEQTRSRILEVAAELFAADGFARTTLAKIAAAAGVSPETVQGQGPKAALLIAAIEHTAFGVAGEENVLNLDLGRKMLAIDDYAEAVEFAIATQADLHQRTAHLAQALSAGAGSYPVLDRYQTDFFAGISSQVRRIVDNFRDRGWLREDIPIDELVETVVVLVSIETYQRIVHRDGWSVSAYRAWLRRMLEETVYVRPQPN